MIIIIMLLCHMSVIFFIPKTTYVYHEKGRRKKGEKVNIKGDNNGIYGKGRSSSTKMKTKHKNYFFLLPIFCFCKK